MRSDSVRLVFDSFGHLAFDRSLKALRHSFAPTGEATEQGLFVIEVGGVGYFLGFL